MYSYSSQPVKKNKTSEETLFGVKSQMYQSIVNLKIKMEETILETYARVWYAYQYKIWVEHKYSSNFGVYGLHRSSRTKYLWQVQENVWLCCCRIMIFCPFTPVIADLQAGHQYIKSTCFNHISNKNTSINIAQIPAF